MIGLCVIAKDEGKDLKEWLDYHLALGISHVYFYDNESSDDTLRILSKYPEVSYNFIKGRVQQLNAYNDCLKHCTENWIGFIDIDEFLIPLQDNLENTLEKYKNYGGLGINWCVYGSSNHIERPQGNIKDNYLYRAETNFETNKHIKSFIQPSRVHSFINPHFAHYKDSYFCVDEQFRQVKQAWTDSVTVDTIRINHYYCKSEEDFASKHKRGRVDHTINTYNREQFIAHNKNEVYDPILLNK